MAMLSHRTEQVYGSWIKRYILFHSSLRELRVSARDLLRSIHSGKLQMGSVAGDDLTRRNGGAEVALQATPHACVAIAIFETAC